MRHCNSSTAPADLCTCMRAGHLLCREHVAIALYCVKTGLEEQQIGYCSSTLVKGLSAKGALYSCASQYTRLMSK